MEEEISIWKMVAIFSLLVVICLVAFLIAKYIVRDSIGWDSPPVDVSDRY